MLFLGLPYSFSTLLSCPVTFLVSSKKLKCLESGLGLVLPVDADLVFLENIFAVFFSERCSISFVIF